jgi:hypothetical protein
MQNERQNKKLDVSYVSVTNWQTTGWLDVG